MARSKGRNKPGKDVRDKRIPAVDVPWEVWPMVLDKLKRYGYDEDRLAAEGELGAFSYQRYAVKYLLDLIVEDATGTRWYGSELQRAREASEAVTKQEI